MLKNKPKWEKGLVIVYLVIYLVATLAIALNQPLQDTPPMYSNAPDEHSRYRVPLYICEHGTLPTGFEEELFSGGCKWTYGFYTLLPYMVQGYTMRFVDMFTDSQAALLYTARLVNVFTGLLMAFVVMLLAGRLFKDSRVKWLFCFMVTFLPQSLFLHTYVNPDSMCLLSTALMLYALVRGYQDGFSKTSCVVLALGVILCALSYYNAYGFIISSILLFAAYFLKKEDGKWKFDYKPFLQKGIAISVVVLLCISWSFIRNYILYDGDIIGLTTKENFVKSYGIVRETFSSRGEPLSAMLFGTSFFPKLIISSIACYGSTSIYTSNIVYVFYLGLLALGILGAIVCRDKEGRQNLAISGWHRVFFHINMIFCIVMPLILTIQYSYTVDYQAQGRYILPALVPIMYYVCHGLEKLPLWRKPPKMVQNILFALVMTGIVVSLCITVFKKALPFYLSASLL